MSLLAGDHEVNCYFFPVKEPPLGPASSREASTWASMSWYSNISKENCSISSSEDDSMNLMPPTAKMAVGNGSHRAGTPTQPVAIFLRAALSAKKITVQIAAAVDML